MFTSNKLNRTAHFARAALILFAIQLWGFGVFTTGAFALSPGEPTPNEIFVSVSYVAGALGAIVYKMTVGSAKHLVGQTFRWRALLWPILWSAIISFPLVFMIMPKFGRPTGHFWTDVIYAYLTTYAIIDMTSDFYILSDIIRLKFQEAVTKDARESAPPALPSSSSPPGPS